MRLKSILLITICSLFFLLTPKSTYAIAFDLVQPSGTLTRGQNIDFTINIDTENTTVTSTEIGMTYDTAVLQFVSVTKGATMTAVNQSDLGGGKLLINGTNSTGFQGTGVFAKVTFKIIAQQSGETEICTLWAPETTPVPTTPNSTPTPTSSVVNPTALPTTGAIGGTQVASLLGAGFILTAIGYYFFNANLKIKKYHHYNKIHDHKKNQP